MIALLLVLVMAPGSLAGAMRVVWCIGADGHRALELSHAGSSHAGPVLDAAPHEAVAAREAEAGSCLDRQLLDKSKVSVPASGGIVPFGLRISVPALFPPTVTDAPIHGSQLPFAPPDPLQAAIRSIVLLI